jgi:osmoprotectant transport system ATP-binding protein
LISFDTVTKRYPDGTVAVDSLSLDAPDGAITVLVGPSGCGKTTSLRMVNRMVEPSGGRILIDGVDVRQRPAAQLRRSIGYVIQHAGLFPHRTIVQNIATVPRLLGRDRRSAQARARELMDLVGLDQALASRYPYQLSGGQQQRVGVARALAADPPVLLMDEPFSAVDPIVRKSLQEEFLRIQAEVAKTILFVTHDIDEAIRIGDKIAVLREGGVLAQFDTPQDLLARPADAFVEAFLGLDRGIRRLTFYGSGTLPLLAEPIVSADTDPTAARDRALADGIPWLLIVDGDRHPVGWADPAALPSARPAAAPGGPGAGRAGLLSCGHGFVPGRDSLRAALDSAVLSPTGWAVAVDEDGRAVGVVSQEKIAAAIRAAHAHEAGTARRERVGADVAEGAGSAAVRDPSPAPSTDTDTPDQDKADHDETGQDNQDNTDQGKTDHDKADLTATAATAAAAAAAAQTSTQTPTPASAQPPAPPDGPPPSPEPADDPAVSGR